jgi:hypothetical protein
MKSTSISKLINEIKVQQKTQKKKLLYEIPDGCKLNLLIFDTEYFVTDEKKK